MEVAAARRSQEELPAGLPQPPLEFEGPQPTPRGRRSQEAPDLQNLGVGPQWRPGNARELLPNEVNTWMISAIQRITDQLTSLPVVQGPPEDPELEFSGKPSEDPVLFFSSLEDWLEDRRIPQERYPKVLRRCLKGAAYSWFVEIQDQEWHLIRALFLQRWDSTNVRSGLWKQLFGVTQKPDERVGPFAMAKWGLFRRLAPEMPESERLAILCELISPATKAYMRGKKFSSLQELIEVGTQVENDLAEIRRNQPRTTQGSGPAGGPVSRPPAPRTDPNPAHPPQGASRPRLPPSPCRWCQGQHFNNDCPTLRRPNPQRSTPQAQARPTPAPRTQDPEARAARRQEGGGRPGPENGPRAA